MIRTHSAVLVVLLLTAGGPPTWPQHAQSPELSLGEALREAEAHNPAVLAAAERTRQSEYGVWQERSALLPMITAQGEYTRHEKPTLVEPMREQPGPQAGEMAFDDEIYSGALRLSAPIVNLPALAGVAGARSAVSARRAQSAETHQSVLARVTEIFVQAAQIDDSMMLLQAHIAALEQRLEDLRTLEAEGRVTAANVAEVESSLDIANSDLLELEQRREELAGRLGGVLGRREPIAPRRSELVSPELPPQTPEGASPYGGPKVQEAEAQLAGAEAAKRGTVLSFAPSVDGFVSQSARSGSDREFSTEWSAGIAVTIPLFTGGERIAKLKSVDAGVSAAQHSYEAAKLSEAAELRAARRLWETAGRRRELLARAVDNQQRVVNAERERYHEGRSSLTDVLHEEATLLELRMQERGLLYEQLLAFVSYQQTAGKLSAELIETLDAS